MTDENGSQPNVTSSYENFDVLSITKKIQQQTRSIEDEIKKVQEILKKQQDNAIQKSISKQSLIKEHHARQSLHQQVKNTFKSDTHKQEAVRHSMSLEPQPQKLPHQGDYHPESMVVSHNRHDPPISSKQFDIAPEDRQAQPNQRSGRTVERPSQLGMIEKGGGVVENSPGKDSRLQKQNQVSYQPPPAAPTGEQNSLKVKRRLKPTELQAPDSETANLNVQVPQTQKLQAQDINRMRDQVIKKQKMQQDQDNLPNNTFHKLFNGNPQQQQSDKAMTKNPSPSDYIKPEDIKMPQIYGESPQQIVKQKARRIAQVNNDRRGMESLPNPAGMRESMDLNAQAKGSKETLTPLKVGSGKFKQFQEENAYQYQGGTNEPSTLRRHANSNSKRGNDSSANIGIQQKVAMNNFLTPIVFVSNNYHGVQPPVNTNSDFQEFVDFDTIKNQMQFGQQQQIHMGAFQNASQNLNKDIIFEEQEEDNTRGSVASPTNPLYFPPLHPQSQALYKPMKQSFQSHRLAARPNHRSEIPEIPDDSEENSAGAQARLGAMLQKIPGGNQRIPQQPIKAQEPTQRHLRGPSYRRDNNYEQQQQDDYTEDPRNNVFYQQMEVETPDDQTLLDNQMRSYCENLEYFIQTANPKLDLIMSRIRLNHPIFKLISASTFSFLVERSFLFKLQANFGAYQEGFRAMNNLYFILYGELRLVKKSSGPFGEPLIMGYTVGEEILFSDRDQVIRTENCLATSPEGAALLQVNVDEFIKMGTTRQMTISRGASLMKDFKVLMGILQNNYELKQKWRW